MSKRGKVALFWPEERIKALQQFSKDETLPDENLDKSAMWAWMREFCQSAPSWLIADSTRLKLQVKAQDALAKVAAAQSELESLLEALEGMAPLTSNFQDRWARRIVDAPHEPAVPAARPELDPEAPAQQAKVPKAGQKLPSELAFDRAHGRPEGGKSKIDAESALAEEISASNSQARQENVPVSAAPNQGSDAHLMEGDKSTEALPAPVAQRTTSHAAAEPSVQKEEQTVTVRRSDGSVLQRKSRVGFRMALSQISSKHGQHVADFLINGILPPKSRYSTEEVRMGMARFRGNYPTVQAARKACAESLGHGEKPQELDSFKLTDHALIDEREDGSCSLWAKE